MVGALRFAYPTILLFRISLARRPCESRDPYAVPYRLVAEAEAFCPTNAGGYGSLLSQERRKRIQLSDSRHDFTPRGAKRPGCA